MSIIDQNSLPVVLTRNQLLPDEGPKCIPVTVTFVTGSLTWTLDLEQLINRGFISIVQTLWIDTRQCANPVSISFDGGSQQTIVGPARTQGYFNVLATNPVKMSLTGVDGDSIQVILINVPIPGAIWQPASGGSSLAPGGPQFAVQFNNPLGQFAGDSNLTYDGVKFTDTVLGYFGPPQSSLNPFIQNWNTAELDVVGKDPTNFLNTALFVQSQHPTNCVGMDLLSFVSDAGGAASKGITINAYANVDCFALYGIEIRNGSVDGNITENYGIDLRSIEQDGIGTLDSYYAISIDSSSNALVSNHGLRIFGMTGATNNWAIQTHAGLVEFGDIVKYSGPNVTGAGIPLPGANCPAVDPTTPYTWIKAKAADDSDVYIACYK